MQSRTCAAVILALGLSDCTSAQTVHEVCYRITEAGRPREKCMVLPQGTVDAMTAFVLVHTTYSGPCGLLFNYLRNAFLVDLLDKHPSAAVQAAQASVTTAQSSLQTAKDAELPVVPTQEP